MTKTPAKNSPANLAKRILKAKKAIAKAEKKRDKALWLLIKPFIGNGRTVTVHQLAEWLKNRGGVGKLVRGKKGYIDLAWDCVNATKNPS